MRILLWHVHGAWTTAFVQGKHTYLVPVTPDRGPFGRGRAQTYDWPPTVEETPPERLAREDIDVVVAQRPEELDLIRRWLPDRRPPVVYVEHNTPRGDVPATRHPMADRDDLTLVHVTHFNALFWDAGGTRTAVVEHGIPDPGERYTGELPRLGTALNEPLRRWRTTGTDLLPYFAETAPVDVYGMRVAGLAEHLADGDRTDGDRIVAYEDLPQAMMHRRLARRRAYLHPTRWTSLGLSLLEAMSLGMPVVALASTDAIQAVPPDAGVLSTRLDELRDGVAWLMRSPDDARRMGRRARAAARTRYSVDRFLSDWDLLLGEVTR